MSAINPSAPRGVLVVYYSMSGNTERVARDLAQRMNADVERVRDRERGTGFVEYMKCVIDAVRGKAVQIGNLARDPRDYALVVIGTPVWVWHMTPAIRAYLTRFAGKFGNIAFFVTSGDTDVSKLVPSLESVARRSAIAAAGFNARELASSTVYEARLQEFVRALNQASGWMTDDAASAVPAR